MATVLPNHLQTVVMGNSRASRANIQEIEKVTVRTNKTDKNHNAAFRFPKSLAIPFRICVSTLGCGASRP